MTKKQVLYFKLKLSLCQNSHNNDKTRFSLGKINLIGGASASKKRLVSKGLTIMCVTNKLELYLDMMQHLRSLINSKLDQISIN